MAVTYDVSNGRKFTDEPTLDVLVDGSAILLVHTEKGVKSLRADALSKFITGDLTGLNTSDKSGLIAAINEVLGVTGDNGRAITALQTLTKMLSATGASRANSFIYEYDLGTSFTNDQSADIIAGTFFICGLGAEDFTDLPDDLAEKYERLFRYPQAFARVPNGILMISENGRTEIIR